MGDALSKTLLNILNQSRSDNINQTRSILKLNWRWGLKMMTDDCDRTNPLFRTPCSKVWTTTTDKSCSRSEPQWRISFGPVTSSRHQTEVSQLLANHVKKLESKAGKQTTTLLGKTTLIWWTKTRIQLADEVAMNGRMEWYFTIYRASPLPVQPCDAWSQDKHCSSLSEWQQGADRSPSDMKDTRLEQIQDI